MILYGFSFDFCVFAFPLLRAPTTSQEAPNLVSMWPTKSPRVPKEGPTLAQEWPKTAHEIPETPQEGFESG